MLAIGGRGWGAGREGLSFVTRGHDEDSQRGGGEGVKRRK